MVRQRLKHLYGHTVDILRTVETKNEIGVPEETESTVISDMQCRIYMKKGVIEIGESGVMENYTHRCICETSGVQATDIILDGNTRYLVLRVYNVKTKKRFHHYEMELREQYA